MQRNKRIPPERLLQGGFGSEDSFVAFIDVLSGTGTSASQRVAKCDARRIIEDAVAQLPPDYQQVVTLYELQGMSADEVAKTMGRSVGAIYMVRKRALEALRGLLPSQSQI